MAKTILVVDDKANVRTLVREYLTAEGFRVATANNGRDALFVARDVKPDLILLDIMMPEMSGYDFCKRTAKNATRRSFCSLRNSKNRTRCWAWNWARTIM